MDTCYLCGGLLELLGTLGRLAHYRCIDCGMEHSAGIDNDPTPTKERTDNDTDMENQGTSDSNHD
ncbi:hypothetical protein LCGC14_1484960 [marine sediment metagenome]|uniref:Uncharacterized protein n=1 Tax=marine sediment metagenome TaxID=412755 RepID=A0A0F9JU99_9ZZZZ